MLNCGNLYTFALVMTDFGFAFLEFGGNSAIFGGNWLSFGGICVWFLDFADKWPPTPLSDFYAIPSDFGNPGKFFLPFSVFDGNWVNFPFCCGLCVFCSDGKCGKHFGTRFVVLISLFFLLFLPLCFRSSVVVVLDAVL